MALLDTVIIALLVLAWGWVLGKPFLASRVGPLRRDPVGAFHRQLDLLARAPRTADGWPRPRRATSRRQAAARRRQVFLALVISVVASLVLALAFGGVFTALHLVMDVLFVSFVGLAVLAGRRLQRGAEVVRLRPAMAPVRDDGYARVVGES